MGFIVNQENSIVISLSVEQIAALWRIADERGVPASDLVEKAVYFYLDNSTLVDSFAIDEDE